MDSQEHRKRIEEFDKKSNEELLSLIRELTSECEEKRKSCAKLQSEVQLIQNNLAERNSARAAKVAEYSDLLDLVPLAEKANAANQRILDLERELKGTKTSREEKHHRRQELQTDIRSLQTERSQLENNYSALLENMANVKSQVEMLEKAVPQTSRSQSRREADERLDDLLKQYLPERLFKSRRREDK